MILSGLVRAQVPARVRVPRKVQQIEESDEPSSGPCTFIKSQKKAKAKELYLKGKSRKPYRKSKNLSSSFEDTDLLSSPSSNPVTTVHFEPSEWNDKVCKSCAPVLMKYSET